MDVDVAAGVPRKSTGNLCRAWYSGTCTYGDSCMFSHVLVRDASLAARETIGSRAAANAMVVPGRPANAEGSITPWSESGSSQDKSSGSSNSSVASRSWADQSEDIWPEAQPPDALRHTSWDTSTDDSHSVSSRHTWSKAATGGSKAGDGGSKSGDGGSKSGDGQPLPSFNDRLDFPEYIPGHETEDLRQEKPMPSKSSRRRKQRELADKRVEYRTMNQKLADQAAEAVLLIVPSITAAIQRHLDFPRSEESSPRRAPAPPTTPRTDFPKEKHAEAEGAGAGAEDEEDQPDVALPLTRSGGASPSLWTWATSMRQWGCHGAPEPGGYEEVVTVANERPVRPYV